MNKSKAIQVPLYNYYFKIIVSDDIEELKKDKDVGNVYKKDDMHFAQTIDYSTLINKINQDCIFIVLNPKHPTSKLTHGIIAHECLHCVNMLMDSRGHKADRNNDEPDAYLLAWFVDETYKYLNKLKIKL